MATRDITTAVQGNLEDDVVYPFFAVELLFDDSPLRLWTGLGTRVYDGNSWAGAIPEDERLEVRIAVRTQDTIGRTDRLIPILADSKGLTPEQVDALFGIDV